MNECLICYEQGDLIKIKCGHSFHYNCIIQEYKIKQKCVCPYCRTNNKNLILKTGYLPIYKIHKEYSDFIKQKYFCQGILKSGKNKGKICNKRVLKSGSCVFNTNSGLNIFYCNKHSK